MRTVTILGAFHSVGVEDSYAVGDMNTDRKLYESGTMLVVAQSEPFNLARHLFAATVFLLSRP